MNENGTDYPERTIKETIGLGFAGRCPRCGQGRIFRGRLEIVDECPVCGLVLSEHDAGDGAVVPALLILVTLAVWVEFKYEPALWVHIVLWGPIGTLLTLWLLPRLKGIGVALQHKHRSTEVPTKPGGA
ncbi:MAG: DUF983 domain-containing protein [Rhodospirillales bacterium]|nr:DUF983 domain-containing protein [Rhodospirillales bacterium]MBO6785476.1 DUF983 domain-containing protein [Rhodospirillales bacterium]